MGGAQLSEGHLTPVIHLWGAKQEGISLEEIAGTGRRMLVQWWWLHGYKVISGDNRVKALSNLHTLQWIIKQCKSNIRIYIRASTHILLSVLQTVGLLCHMSVQSGLSEWRKKTCVASVCWLCWVGGRRDLIQDVAAELTETCPHLTVIVTCRLFSW